jgi:hypothetical protein
MLKAWSTSAPDGETLARAVEAHLNEYADEVVAVAYALDKRHHVLAIYRPLEGEMGAEVALAMAERVITEAQG